MTDMAGSEPHRVSDAAELCDSIWVASALVTVLGKGVVADGDPAAELLAAAALLERGEGGWVPVPARALRRELAEGQSEMVCQRLISALGQAATIAARGAGAGWEAYSEDVLLAQGRFSTAAGRGVRALIDAIPELAATFETGGVMIDVGVGVAAAACAICGTAPTVRVIGLDVNAHALALAREMVAANGLADRVELRLQGVEELTDTGIASLAHVSPPFIPRPALVQGLANLHRALKSGARLVLSGISSEGAAGAIGRWQAHNAGGSAGTLADCEALVTAAGFEPPQLQPRMSSGAPKVAFCRRP